MIRSTGTGEIDRLGGLLKCLPWTGHLFLIGSLAICGLPLLNGFISEWLVFRAMFEGMFHFKMNALIFSSLGIVALSLMGGLAAACFTKAFGTIFLGDSRSIDNSRVKENTWVMLAPMVLLGGICLWVGLYPSTMVSFALEAASNISSIVVSPRMLGTILSPLMMLAVVLIIFILMMTVLLLFKRRAMKVLPVTQGETWKCAFSHPTSRMQYTASSFAEPLLRNFRNVLGFQVKGKNAQDYFPMGYKVSSQVVEASEKLVFRPIFEFIKSVCARLKIIQCGYTQVYLVYILAFLLFLLIWKMV